MISKNMKILVLLCGLIAPISVLAESTYWQEFKALKENPAYSVVFDKEASVWTRILSKDIHNAKHVGYWGRFVRPLISHGIIVTEQTMPALYGYVDTLCKNNGLETPTVVVTWYKGFWNAAAQKLLAASGAIIIGQDLLKECSKEVVEGIVAHEIGHIKHNHINQLVAVQLTETIARYMILMRGYGLTFTQSMVASIFIPDVLTPLLIGKRFEWEADNFACEQAGSEEGLIASCEELERKMAKRDADLELIRAQLENDSIGIEKADLDDLKWRHYMATWGRSWDKAWMWVYHNTPYGPHPSNEARIENAKRILAKKQSSLAADVQQQAVVVAV
jgi:Zn-dependent protease with chaperone function